MKKICSVIITTIMMFCAVIPNAVAAGFSTEDITITPNGDKIQVIVKLPTEGVMTAQVINKAEETENATYYDLQTDRNPTKEFDASGKHIGYQYTFSFGMSDALTGMYVLSVGNNVKKTQKEFPYIQVEHKIKFYDTLDIQTPSALYAFFTQKPEWIPEGTEVWIPMDEKMCDAYANLSKNPAVMQLVNETIAKESWTTGITEESSVSDIRKKLAEKDKLFTEKMSEWLDISRIAIASEDTWEEITKENLGAGFDDYFYNIEKVGTAVLDISDACEYFETEAILAEDLQYENYYSAFDKATLVLIKNTRSAGVLKNAFVYFEDKGTISADMTYIDALLEAEKDSNLWKKLKADNTITDCESLITSALRIAKEMVDDGVLSESGSGSSGGGGGGGGSSSIDKESLSGGSSTPKPVAPKPTVTPEDSKGIFTDLDTVAWAKEAIEALAEKNVLSGKGDGKFYPEDSVTREEFVKIIVAAFELEEEEAKCTFSDVSEERWSYPYIAVANQLGIVQGEGENFAPEKKISRQDMAVIIDRVFHLLSLETSGETIVFTDDAAISDYARSAVENLTAAGIINGMGDGTFAPHNEVTRAQAAKVVYSLLLLVGGGK